MPKMRFKKSFLKRILVLNKSILFIGPTMPSTNLHFDFTIVGGRRIGAYVYFHGFVIAEAFILLSLITLPHVLVMHRLYNET